MKKLVPICIVLNSNQSGDGTMPIVYPNFNQLDPKLRGNMDWSYFMDRHGYGMHYSRVKGGHGKPECSWALVPKAFAEAAAKAFAEVTIKSEAEWEEFYNKDAKGIDDTEILDGPKLQAIAARIALEKAGVAPSPSKEIQELRRQCLDPKCELGGINHNHRKTWTQAKAHDGIEIE